MDDFAADRPTYGSLSATPPLAMASRPAVRWPWLLTITALALVLGLLLSPSFTTEVRKRLFGNQRDSTAELVAISTAQARAITALKGRIDKLEKAGGPSGSDPARMVRAEAQVNELQSQIGALGVRVEGAVTGAAEDAQTAQGVLLIAAVRRAIETGQALGPLEPSLRARYGQGYPGPVEALVAAGVRPVTLTRLRQDFLRIQAALSADPDAASDWWAALKSAIGGIVSVRRAGELSVEPAAQMALASQRLDNGDVVGAAAIISRLPGNRVAAGWLADSRRYGAAQAALVQIEAAALAS